MADRKQFDLDAHVQRIQNAPCFICEMVAGWLDGNHVIYQDDHVIAFLNKYPMLYGYALVAPADHREHVIGDFTLAEYLALQAAVYRVAEAVRRTVALQRVCILSLDSQQGNRHVHWRIALLPAGAPLEQQQLEVLRAENGILDLTDAEMQNLAQRIREDLDDPAR